MRSVEAVIAGTKEAFSRGVLEKFSIRFFVIADHDGFDGLGGESVTFTRFINFDV